MDRYERSLRRAIVSVLLTASVLLLLPVAPSDAGAVGGGWEGSRDRDYGPVTVADLNSWSATVSGQVRFYDAYRHFKIYGDVTAHRGGWTSNYGVYLYLQPDLANTSSDGRGYTIGAWCCSDRYDRLLEAAGPGPDGNYFYYIGESRGGEYFAETTVGNRGLKGLSIKLCHYVDGPDVCGRTTYVDNPYEPSPPPPGPDLLVNGGFESGSTSPWIPISLPGSVNYANYSGSSFRGLRYEEINFLQPSASFGQDVAVAAAPGQRYRFSIWMRKPGACGTGKWRGTLTLWGLGGGNENASAPIAITPCAGWQRVSVTFSPHNTGHNTLRAEIYGATARAINVDLDQAHVRQVFS